jgi:hypothetical protein
MISDELDDDADTLDDEAALGTYLGDTPPAPKDDVGRGSDLPDWPAGSAPDLGLSLDAETLAWFQATYGDWRGAMRTVLRAWVAAKAAAAAGQIR